MTKNLGTMDRVFRVLAGIAMLICSVMAPFPLAARGGLGATGVYMLFTALAGTCLGYKMMGRSTCPVSAAR